jgi:hypothetical protein
MYSYRRLRTRSNFVRRVSTWPVHWITEKPIRILFLILALWISGSLVFWRAAYFGAMVPTNKDAVAELKASRPLPPGYPTFHPFVYTLENVLPVVRLGQDDKWAPSNKTWMYVGLARLRWFLILSGWVLAGILTIAIGEQFKQ